MNPKRRCTVELLGFNNGRSDCKAVKEKNGWKCWSYTCPEDEVTVPTMREAGRELQDLGATEIIRCPALPEETPGL